MANGDPVDLSLVLAVDCSSSINAADFQLELAGIAAALRNPQVAKAIAGGEHRRIAITVMQWADRQAVTTPWRVLASDADLAAAAQEIEVSGRRWEIGGTALAAALGYSIDLLARYPVDAGRRVIDVSGDGNDNVGGNVGATRDHAVALGITVNGLPITNGSKLLPEYYRTYVIGGAGAFIEPAESMLFFHDAILKKFLREIDQAVS